MNIGNINIDMHIKKIILNKGQENILYDHCDYLQLLKDLKGLISDKDIDRVKEWMGWNCNLIDELIKKENKTKNNEQLKLF